MDHHSRTALARAISFAALLFLPACGADGEEGAASQAQATDAGEQVLPVAFRGVLSLGLEERGFIPCGEELPAWVIDATSGELLDGYSMLAGIPNEPVYAELVGVMGDPPRSGPGARYGYGFEVVEVRQLSFGGDGLECPEVEYGLVARGNEPDWAVRFAADGAEMQSSDLTQPIGFPPASERREGNARILSTIHEDGRSLEVVMTPGACVDTMSGERFPWTAVRRWQGSEDLGCAFGDG